MKKTILLSIICILYALTAHATLKVVATTTDLAAITKAIGGDRVSVDAICKGFEDPHMLMAKPSYILKASRADLWICIGMDLEIGWEPLIIAGSRNGDIQPGSKGYLNCSTRIAKLEVPAVIDRAYGDIHPLGNHHYMLDPFNGRIVAEDIAQRLSELSPEDSDFFAKNLERFKTELDIKMFGKELVAEYGGDILWRMLDENKIGDEINKKKPGDLKDSWYGKMQKIKGLKYVAYHKTWSYLNKRFGIEAVAYIEPKPGIPPTPSHLLEVIRTINNQNVKLLVQAVYYSTKASDMLQEKTKIKVITIPPSVGGEEGVDTYPDLFDHIVSTFLKAANTEKK